MVQGLSVERSGIWSEIGPNTHEIGPKLPPVRNRSEIVQDRTPPIYRGPVRPAADDDAALARWRHSQRHAEADADWSEIDRVWTWLETPYHEQRSICAAPHDHVIGGKCRHPHCHPQGCHARHGHGNTIDLVAEARRIFGGDA
jgi:hypothetical protein